MRKYALIGRSLDHSFSKSFFTDYFTANSIEAEYHNIELDTIEAFGAIKYAYDGFNVTIPYKEAIIPFLDELDPLAREIGAVNTIKREGRQLTGYNTDAYGFHQCIKPFLTGKHERALVLGTGGASRAVVYVLKSLGIEVFQISRANRGERTFGWDGINENMIRSCKFIVNCTPLGMYPEMDAYPKIPFEALSDEHLVADLIYNPAKTVFLKKAEDAGAIILNGESMLREQALKAYLIWTGENV